MNISADYLIRGKGTGFETDMLIELLSDMDKHSRESAVRILREYVGAINRVAEKGDSQSPQTPD